MAQNLVEVTITAQNQFSDAVKVRGSFNFSIFDGGSATVSIYRSFDYANNPSSPTWLLIRQYVYTGTNVSVEDFESEGAYYRTGVETGDYTSGTIKMRIGNTPPSQGRN